MRNIAHFRLSNKQKHLRKGEGLIQWEPGPKLQYGRKCLPILTHISMSHCGEEGDVHCSPGPYITFQDFFLLYR